VGVRAAAMSANELEGKRMALDRLLEQTAAEVTELQVLLRQRSSDMLAGVEHELAAQVRDSISEVQDHLRLFQGQLTNEHGRAFGALLEDFLMNEVESVFRRWRVREDEKLQTQLNALSSRFVAQANEILERLERAAGDLFSIPIQHLTINCPLRVESHLRYKVERIFYSLDSFLLLLPGFLLRPIVLGKTHRNVQPLLDMNAGRIRFDYLERLQSSLTRFEEHLCAAIAMVSVSLKSVLHVSTGGFEQQATAVDSLDSVIQDCRRFLQ
jgi:hypothetical protein